MADIRLKMEIGRFCQIGDWTVYWASPNCEEGWSGLGDVGGPTRVNVGWWVGGLTGVWGGCVQLGAAVLAGWSGGGDI